MTVDSGLAAGAARLPAPVEQVPARAPGVPAQRLAPPSVQLAPTPARRRRVYVSVSTKFALAQAFALCWLLFSIWLGLPWLRDLREPLGTVPAVVIVALIAWVPGWLVAMLAASVVLDRQPDLPRGPSTAAVTVIVAARNEAATIEETLRYIARSDHRGPVEVILADNGSTDGTAEIARAAAVAHGLTLTVVREERPGKANALNAALAHVRTDLVATVDADTLLHRSALRNLTSRLDRSPADVDAVAGSVLVRNSRAGFWARVQEWDYFLGIASIKRVQGLYQGTLVAQGAFSLYRTAALRAVGGWPDAIGEDIVVTWKMLARGGRVYYEPLAVAFTGAPTGLRHLARQRARWARGMIEGLRTVPPWRQPTVKTRLLTSVNVLIPALDVAYVFLWLPGLVLACTGRFWIVGPATAAVLPLTLLVNWLLFRFQRRKVFARLGLRVRRNVLGFVCYVLMFQMVMSPVAVAGYCQELLGLRRRWK